VDFWDAKITRNQNRDAESVKKLQALGWTPIIVWECELKDVPTLTKRLADLLGHGKPPDLA
jgi:DNA mismatch endonuclease (patch repair protein)